jgi:hypothetical protein
VPAIDILFNPLYFKKLLSLGPGFNASHLLRWKKLQCFGITVLDALRLTDNLTLVALQRDMLLRINGNGPHGTGNLTQSTAHAFRFIHDQHPVIITADSTGRANSLTISLFALLAKHRDGAHYLVFNGTDDLDSRFNRISLSLIDKATYRFANPAAITLRRV